MKVRLQKFLADAGIASRRACEKHIVDGRVTLNGKIATELGTKVDPLHDRVLFDGDPVKVKRKLYLALNKPPGYVCTRSDEFSRRVIFDLLPAEWSNLFSVGRLDMQSEGLILLTNDGDFSLKVSHPRYGLKKIYRVEVEGRVQHETLRLFTDGIFYGGEKLKANRARLLHASNGQSVVELELTEGKNREIRRLFDSQGISVTRLRRIRMGSISLGELPLGKWRTLTETEIKSLLPKL